MLITETVTFWVSVTGYAASFMLLATAVFFRKEALLPASSFAFRTAFTMQTAALLLRWLGSGYPPFAAFFASVSVSCWFAALGYLLLLSFRPNLKSSGIVVLPILFLLLGWAGTPSYAGKSLGANLQSAWLFIHPLFASAGIGAFIVAAGISGMSLWKRTHDLRDDTSRRAVDETVFRFISIGFLFYTVMLFSGAIWANQAWGRYWGWDPIETWSLITWLVYAVYLHLHFTFPRLRGDFSAWFAILAVLFSAFSFWGVGFVYRTIHAYG